MKILIVEDTEDARVLLEDQLHVHGYEVESATNGIEALNKARKSLPDLIVSDILMPEMDGFELCRQVKRDSVLHKLPFIFYTATYTGETDKRFALSLGASRFVVKPEDPNRFLSIIEDVLSEHASGELPVPGKPSVSDDILEHMHVKALTEKLSKKIHELEKQKKHLQLITDAMPVLMSDLGPDYRFRYVNLTYEKWYQIKRSDIIGKHIREVVGDETFQVYEPYLRKAFDGKTISFEARLPGQDNKIKFIQAQYIPHNYGDEGDCGIFELIYDISERKQAEQELYRHREHLEELVSDRTAQLNASNKELEAFCYTVSHDLRAPLRIIDGFSRILVDDYGASLDSSGINYLDRISENVHDMENLIDDLLKLSRFSSVELKKDIVDMSAIAGEVVQSIQKNYPEKNVDCIIKDNMKVRGDAALIKVMLQNLLDNAWKFTEQVSSPRIEFGSYEQNGREVFFVSDNGAGFDMKYKDKLFVAFQRLHDEKKYQGTGIGLASVQRIVHRHGGEIWATGGLDKGATFYFTLG